jgi:hypothetical protein
LLQSLAGCIATAGTVVLAQTVLADNKEDSKPTPATPDERADRLADELPVPPDGGEYVAFLNRAFRNARGVGGGFRNGGFRNGGVGGGFANGGFRNGAGAGGFRNGAFRNW